MYRMMIAAAAVLVPAAASATSTINVSRDGYTATISYRDLDLGSPADRKEMAHRIQRAAGMLCFDPVTTDPLVFDSRREDCYRVAVQSGVEQLDEIAGRNAG